MARPETLIPGNCYFSVHFYDNDLLLPMIDTLIYVGRFERYLKSGSGREFARRHFDVAAYASDPSIKTPGRR